MEHYAQNAMRAASDSSATMNREIIDGTANFAILKPLNTRRLILGFGGKGLSPRGRFGTGPSIQLDGNNSEKQSWNATKINAASTDAQKFSTLMFIISMVMNSI